MNLLFLHAPKPRHNARPREKPLTRRCDKRIVRAMEDKPSSVLGVVNRSSTLSATLTLGLSSGARALEQQEPEWLTYAEAAERLNVSPHAVRARATRLIS